jgi:hypothetical protein
LLFRIAQGLFVHHDDHTPLKRWVACPPEADDLALMIAAIVEKQLLSYAPQ